MVFRIRVTLAGIKGFYRLYSVNGATTLYDIHKQLRSDLEFAQDQIIMFKALDVTGGVVARYGLFDLGSGTVDRVTLEDAVKAGTDSFVYFYDVTNKKSVILTVEGEAEGERVTGLALRESKGPNPIEFENGYVAYEDLPERQRYLPGEEPEDDDDEDFDEDEEEEPEEDEDGKEIYDENE
ncbi:MAG: hypothetical protein IJU21_06015 [Bacteroidales bacterium]|nr:hypothetical protein [Bacteroidales bacterium]